MVIECSWIYLGNTTSYYTPSAWMLLIPSVASVATFVGSVYENAISWDNNTVSWHYQGSETNAEKASKGQCNYSPATYYYLAIGQ